MKRKWDFLYGQSGKGIQSSGSLQWTSKKLNGWKSINIKMKIYYDHSNSIQSIALLLAIPRKSTLKNFDKKKVIFDNIK
jgi:hypothetical protein